MSLKRKAEGDPVVEVNGDDEQQENGEDDEYEDGDEGSLEGDNDEDGGDEFDNIDNSEEGEFEDEEAKAFVSAWLASKRDEGVHPAELLKSIGINLPIDPNLPLEATWSLLETLLTRSSMAVYLFDAFSGRNHRHKLPHINTFDDVIELLRTCSRIVILTGAGVSVSCGIPDFRSPGGLYEQVEHKYNLPDPQCLFDIHYLRDDPNPFFEFAREIYPGNHNPSPTHYFIKELESRGKLLRNYTQNIDTLEFVAGINPEKVVNCHGSFATASCMVCKRCVTGDAIRDEIMKNKIPQCSSCNLDGAFMKPDIVFFGEALPDRFGQCFAEDSEKIDLLIVMGSSLKVQPVCLIPELTDQNIPQILVNREIVGQPHEFDYTFLGDCDQFVVEVCQRLNWTMNGLPPESYIKKDNNTTTTSTSTSTSTTTTTTTITTTIPTNNNNINTNNNNSNDNTTNDTPKETNGVPQPPKLE